MGKKRKDGLAATMKLIGKLHKQAMNFKGLYIQSDKNYHDTREEFFDASAELGSKEETIRDLTKGVEMLKGSNLDLQLSLTDQKTINVKLDEIMKPLVEPRAYLQVKRCEEISVNVTDDRENAIEFALGCESDPDCRWVVGYSVNPEISCLNVEAPDVLIAAIKNGDEVDAATKAMDPDDELLAKIEEEEL